MNGASTSCEAAAIDMSVNLNRCSLNFPYVLIYGHRDHTELNVLPWHLTPTPRKIQYRAGSTLTINPPRLPEQISPNSTLTMPPKAQRYRNIGIDGPVHVLPLAPSDLKGIDVFLIMSVSSVHPIPNIIVDPLLLSPSSLMGATGAGKSAVRTIQLSLHPFFIQVNLNNTPSSFRPYLLNKTSTSPRTL